MHKGREAFSLFEVQFLAQAVAAHAQAVGRNAQQGGDVFRGKVYFDQGYQAEIVAGKIVTAFFEVIEKLLVHLFKNFPEFIPVAVVAEVEVYLVDELAELFLMIAFVFLYQELELVAKVFEQLIFSYDVESLAGKPFLFSSSSRVRRSSSSCLFFKSVCISSCRVS